MKYYLKYLLFSVSIFIFIGCGGGTTTTEEPNTTEQQNTTIQAALSGGDINASPVSKPSSPDSVLATASVNDSITISWQAPVVNSDGSYLTDLAGYYIYYGKIDDYGNTGDVVIDVVDIQDATSLSYTISNIIKDDYFFVVSAYSQAGVESKKVAVASNVLY